MPRSLRPILALAGAALVGLAPSAGARAGEQVLTFRSAPIAIKPYFTAEGIQRVESPHVDGYVVGMKATVVDAQGRELGDQDVMLHHVVFASALHRDLLCSTYTGFTGGRLSYAPERFFGVGEERYELSLPAGYGYPNASGDVWGIAYMLMNHHARAQTVYVRYTVRYVTGEQLTPVRPLWLDVRNCFADPVWDVPGTGGKASTYARTADVVMPESGRIVAAGGHLHGGGISLDLSNATCGASLFTSWPSWGRGEPKPLLHEGGPAHMSAFQSEEGISVTAGDALRLTATYDNSLPHTRVMGIMLAYLAPGPVARCAPVPQLRLDVGQPGPPPLQPMPLPRAAKGPLRPVKSTWVGDYRFADERVAIRRGTTFTWRFAGPSAHNVTLASGPVGFSSPTMTRGRFSYRFTRPGVYRLYCSLHPVSMVQVVSVR